MHGLNTGRVNIPEKVALYAMERCDPMSYMYFYIIPNCSIMLLKILGKFTCAHFG